MTQTQTMQTPDATLSHTTTTTTTTTDAISHTTPPATLSHTTPQSVEFDFDNDDDAFHNFIEFGIASNGGRLSMK